MHGVGILIFFDRLCVMVANTSRYHWYCLLGAILFEVGGTTVMKLAQGWGFPHANMVGLGCMWAAIGISYYLLARATTGLPVGVAYALWEGLGLTCVTVVSVVLLEEALTVPRISGLFCVLAGAALVHHGTGSSHAEHRTGHEGVGQAAPTEGECATMRSSVGVSGGSSVFQSPRSSVRRSFSPPVRAALLGRKEEE